MRRRLVLMLTAAILCGCATQDGAYPGLASQPSAAEFDQSSARIKALDPVGSEYGFYVHTEGSRRTSIYSALMVNVEALLRRPSTPNWYRPHMEKVGLAMIVQGKKTVPITFTDSEGSSASPNKVTLSTSDLRKIAKHVVTSSFGSLTNYSAVEARAKSGQLVAGTYSSMSEAQNDEAVKFMVAGEAFKAAVTFLVQHEAAHSALNHFEEGASSCAEREAQEMAADKYSLQSLGPDHLAALAHMNGLQSMESGERRYQRDGVFRAGHWDALLPLDIKGVEGCHGSIEKRAAAVEATIRKHDPLGPLMQQAKALELLGALQ